MKHLFLTVLPGIVCFSAVFSQVSSEPKATETDATVQTIATDKSDKVMRTFFDFKAIAIDGSEFDMAQLKGKKVMVVNVATYCGYTPQYKKLQQLYSNYKDKDFVVLGFPCNQFMGQEPGTEEEIKQFCEKNYGVTFPLFTKVDVKGDDQDPIYEWLTTKELNGVENSTVGWNFNKYLIDENGNYVKHLKSTVDPLDKSIIAWIEGN